MPALVTAMFTFPLGEDAALLLRTAALTDAYHEPLAANSERLARWEPWAAQPPTPDSTRSFLEASGRAWLQGTELPAAIAVPAGDRWQLVGSAGLRISSYTQSAEGGYWIDAAFEGRGLVTRAMTALLDQAFGPLSLARVTLHTEVANQRSRALAARLGFTEEGVNRQALPFPHLPMCRSSSKFELLLFAKSGEGARYAGNTVPREVVRARC
jgi:ribosomal-protein-serine acetyltransferase